MLEYSVALILYIKSYTKNDAWDAVTHSVNAVPGEVRTMDQVKKK